MLLEGKKGLIVGVTYGFTGHPLVHQMAAMVNRGTLGEIRIVDMAYTHGFNSGDDLGAKSPAQAMVDSDDVPMRPERVVSELSAALPDDAIVVVDTGHSGMWSGQHLHLRSARQMFLRAAGSLGWGFPAALGAKCAFPHRPVVCFTGDGGFFGNFPRPVAALLDAFEELAD